MTTTEAPTSTLPMPPDFCSRVRAYSRLKAAGFTRRQALALADAGFTVFYVPAAALVGGQG